MIFLSPEMLWLLLCLPLVVAAYFWLQRRKKAALKYASLAVVKEAIGPGQRLRRHLPPLLLLACIALLALAVARPAAVITLPSEQQTIILAMDVSLSMRATDVEPDRITAAQAAARDFVAVAPRGARLGVVSFAGTASLVQPPTHNRDEVLAAIDAFQLQRATAVGSGILVSLRAIFPDLALDLVASDPRDPPDSRRRGLPLDGRHPADKAPRKPVPPGSYKSAVIVLLSDGQTTTGPDPIQAARVAADRGVRVFTVGFGTPYGEVVIRESYRIRVRVDEETLKEIAGVTGGEYYYAGTALDLKHVYQDLGTRLILERKETELTSLFSAAAALLAVAAAGLSLLWFNRLA